jgi:hypothetical protein
MSLTLSIDQLSASAADVAVPALDQTDLVHLKTYTPPGQPGVQISQYLLPATNNRQALTVTVRSEGIAATGRGPKDYQARKVSIALRTWARIVSSDTAVEDLVEETSAAISWTIPSIAVEAGDVMVMLNNLFALLWTTLTSKVPDTDRVASLNLGLTEVY